MKLAERNKISRCLVFFPFSLVEFIKYITLASSVLKYRVLNDVSFPAWTTNSNLKILCPKLESDASFNKFRLKIPHADVLATMIYFGPQDLSLNTPLKGIYFTFTSSWHLIH